VVLGLLWKLAVVAIAAAVDQLVGCTAAACVAAVWSPTAANITLVLTLAQVLDV
jgi:hypothetical protein